MTGIKGEINNYCEIGLALNLCQYVPSVCIKELIEGGLLQGLADLMLSTRSAEIWLQILNSISSLVEKEEFLEAMRNVKLTIKNKPEIIYVEEKVTEPKVKRSRERSKDKHKRDSKEGGRKSKKNRHKRSKSRSSEKRTVVEKKRKVISNSLGELVDVDNDIQTLYQLFLSLMLSRQNSTIIIKLKEIIEKINFIDNLKELTKADSKLSLAFNVETVFEYLQKNGFISNEVGNLLVHYEFIKGLLNLLVIFV